MNRAGAALPPRFEARAALSEGTSPRVVAAFDRETGRRVVLKIGGGAGSEESLALRKEFRLLASLDHPSIVKARDFGFTADGLAWFSTDEVDGPDLASFARSHALLENLSALADVAHALDYVHSRGLVHGDVKPTNVRVLGERAFLLDFGLAFARGEEVAGIRGTPAYLAPEVLRGGKPDRRADLYALGVTFYEALTGVLPTAGRDLGGVLRFHLEEDVPVASRVTPGIPSRLDRILAQLMERDPAARTPSARTLLDDLGRDFGLVRGSTWDARPELLTPPFCGRVELLGRFSQALRHAAEGSGKAIVVLGPEGAGKSRLLAEWRALAQSEGALVVEGRAVAEDRTPYRPVLDVLSALTRRGGSAGAPARAALARVARLAATGADAPPISRLTEESSRLALFDEVLAALEATRRTEAGERPLVVLVDDLHLADRATAALLSFLFKAAESRPLVVAAAAEPAGAARAGGRPERGPHAARGPRPSSLDPHPALRGGDRQRRGRRAREEGPSRGADAARPPREPGVARAARLAPRAARRKARRLAARRAARRRRRAAPALLASRRRGRVGRRPPRGPPSRPGASSSRRSPSSPPT